MPLIICQTPLLLLRIGFSGKWAFSIVIMQNTFIITELLILLNYNYTQNVDLVLVDAGSRHEAAYPSGVCHFLERLAFSGTKNYEHRDEVMHAVEKMGGICDCQTSRYVLNHHLGTNKCKLQILYIIDTMEHTNIKKIY